MIMEKQEVIEIISQELSNSRVTIANDIFEAIMGVSPHYITEDVRKEADFVLQELVEMISYCLRNHEKGLKEASLWGEKTGKYSLASGNTIDQTLFRVTYYKRVIWKFIASKLEEINHSKEFMLDILLEMDIIFNTMVSGFSMAFTDAATKEIEETQDKYISVSTPIVPILPTMGVLTLIGEIDDKRATVMMEKTLFTCKELHFNSLIIDLSGTYKVDDFVIETLLKLIKALRLLGIEPILTGLRSEISQQIVGMGIKLPNIEIHQTIMHVMTSLNK